MPQHHWRENPARAASSAIFTGIHRLGPMVIWTFTPLSHWVVSRALSPTHQRTSPMRTLLSALAIATMLSGPARAA
jgi:hypothetical protein